MLIRIHALAATLFAATAAAAPGDTVEAWTRSFEVSALASHVQTLVGDRFLVVASNGEAAHASRALENALRATERTQLVIDSAPLGDVSKLDDAAIVKKASYLPVDVVLVVRVFGGVDAVITGYDRFGGTLLGLTAVRGQPMRGVSGAVAAAPSPAPAAGTTVPAKAPPEPVTNAAEGASGGAIASIHRIRQQAEARYSKSFIEINEYKDFFGNVGFSEVTQGSQRNVLTWQQFYQVVGRKDLAAQYVNNIGAKYALSYLVGPGVVLGSVAAWAGTQNLLFVGLGVSAGLVLGLYGAFMEIQPVSDQERKKLAEDYNTSLKGSSGLGLLRDPDAARRAIALRPPYLSATFTF